MPIRDRRRASALFAAAFAVAASACGGPQSMLDPAGPAAAEIARGGWLMTGLFSAVWIGVMLLLWYTLRRREAGDTPRRPERLILWGGVALPLVVVAGLLVYGTLTSARVTGVGSEPDAVIEVTARQWQWHFRYRDANDRVIGESIDELAMPLGQMIEFRITSDDVIHSFWIPRLGGKVDAIPGRINVLRLRADRATPIRGQCAEFCGLEHARMVFPVRVLEPAALTDWLAGRDARPDDEPPSAHAPAGRAPPRHGASEDVL
ncbi:cytochrome c oxidase subunit II [Luteimonas sp. 100069]|uniref:cytochrome c oxidase subunit II n=1 Tax=Luteimonas sp. 100069 TaxID=2006109 RepID=UPI000F4F4248|nr:cytochrome c oxidase subunit II [Luteimonas sp. 100069]RPD83445.1 cytochrome c oxidase subunit II [Luteimonas sp. 100069]